MGNRITRAARHLPTDAVQERIRSEKRPWRRQRWEIIYQALTAPRKAEDIARTVGVSLTTVHRVMAAYKQGGVAAIETPGKGGRRHQYLTLSQERALLQPFLARAARGEVATVAEIQQAFEAEAKQPVAPSTISRLLERHGWRQLGARSSSAQAPESRQAQMHSATEPGTRAKDEHKGWNEFAPGSTESKLAQGSTVSARECEEQSTPKVSSERSLQGYPSDLTDQEWAILSPLIPPAKPGGHPRTTDIREVINAVLYVDRTGCQWRALPHEFLPRSTSWTDFCTWRNDG